MPGSEFLQGTGGQLRNPPVLCPVGIDPKRQTMPSSPRRTAQRYVTGPASPPGAPHVGISRMRFPGVPPSCAGGLSTFLAPTRLVGLNTREIRRK